jgi:DNA-binding PadR family transcriptional regulator
MKPNWFYILLSLATGERHGSGVMRDVLTMTDGKLRLWPATLYGSLEELAEQGWIEELEDARDRPPGESEKKRYYRITRLGRRVLAAETERLEGLVRVARARTRRGEEAR